MTHRAYNARMLDLKKDVTAQPNWRRFTQPPFYVPVINATCHHTVYGGSVMWPEVVEAMAVARRACVDMRRLLDHASEVISGYTHAEASHVVSGCAAALQVGAAAIMTGDDKRKMEALPHTAGLMKNEFVARRFGRLRDPAGEPSIAVMSHTDPQVVRVDVRVLSDDEAAQVARRLREVVGTKQTASV